MCAAAVANIGNFIALSTLLRTGFQGFVLIGPNLAVIVVAVAIIWWMRRTAPIDEKAYHRAVDRWDCSFYCHRHGEVGGRGRVTTAAPEEFSALLTCDRAGRGWLGTPVWGADSDDVNGDGGDGDGGDGGGD